MEFLWFDQFSLLFVCIAMVNKPSVLEAFYSSWCMICLGGVVKLDRSTTPEGREGASSLYGPFTVISVQYCRVTSFLVSVSMSKMPLHNDVPLDDNIPGLP